MNTSNFTVEANACLKESIAFNNQQTIYLADQIYSLDTSVGSGKTRAAIRYMTDGYMSRTNFLYVAPTINLVNQTDADLRATIQLAQGHTRNIHLIHSENNGGESVIADTLQYINQSEANIGYVIILTTKTFLNILSMIQNKAAWNVILDEAFEPISFETWYLGTDEPEVSRNYFDNYFDILEDDNNLVVPKEDKKQVVLDIAAGRWSKVGWTRDAGVGITKFAPIVINKALRTEFVKQSGNELIFASYATPKEFSKFNEVVILSALFKQSLLYYLWRSFSIDFQDHSFFDQRQVDDLHKLQGSNLSISHLLHEKDHASKYNLQRNFKTGKPKETNVGHRVIDKLLETISKVYAGEKCLYTTNKWVNNKVVNLGEGFLQIPVYSHGINKYREYTIVAVLSVTNPDPIQLKWLTDRFSHIGITGEDIYNAYRIHSIYQAIGRSAIRNKYNDKPIDVVVIGAKDAQFLHNLFKGSTYKGQMGDLKCISDNWNNRPKHRSPKVTNHPEYLILRKEGQRLAKKKVRNKATQADLVRSKEIIESIDKLKAELKVVPKRD